MLKTELQRVGGDPRSINVTFQAFQPLTVTYIALYFTD